MKPLVMLDLCSGFGGASEAMKRHGWDVTRVDIDSRVKPDIVADMLALPLVPYPVDLLWISPVCREYSRYHQRASLFPGEPIPDHTLFREAFRLVKVWPARFYVIENVEGARIFHGPPTYKIGPYLLWTNLPLKPTHETPFPRKVSISGWGVPKGLMGAVRGRMPYELSDSVRLIVEWASS